MRLRHFTPLAVVLLAACVHLNTDAPQFNDPEVAMVMRAANMSEVREGQIAREKAAEPAVRDFASMMVTEHNAANNASEAAFFKIDLVSADSPLSRQLDAESGASADALRGLTGRDFDRAYMKRQVEVHQKLLNIIDTQLLPNAHKKQVKEQVNLMRTAVQTHLTKAQSIVVPAG